MSSSKEKNPCAFSSITCLIHPTAVVTLRLFFLTANHWYYENFQILNILLRWQWYWQSEQQVEVRVSRSGFTALHNHTWHDTASLSQFTLWLSLFYAILLALHINYFTDKILLRRKCFKNYTRRKHLSQILYTRPRFCKSRWQTEVEQKQSSISLT